MRICIAQNVSLSDHYALSTYLRSISKYLAQDRDIELILLPLKGTRIPDDIPKNVEIHEINGSLYSPKGNIQYSYNLYKKLDEINKKKPIDVVHCLYPNSSVLGAALFKRKFPKTKIIYDVRSPWVEMSIERGSIPTYVAPIFRRVVYFGESILDKYVDGYIFITEGLKRIYENKIKLDSKPFHIIPSGVDSNLFSRKNPNIIRDKYNIKDNEYLLVYVGGIAKMRKLDVILKGFKKLIDNDKNYKLMIVGDGDDRNDLELLTKELYIEKNVIFTGRIPYDEVPFYMSASNAGLCHLPDIFVYRHSFPMKILEYLSCGIPVIASDIDANREISKKIDNIYLYNHIDDFEDMKNVMYKKSDNRLDKYDWTNICAEIKMIWENM